jgi:hypothetical protein
MLMERIETFNFTRLPPIGSRHSDMPMRTSSIKEASSWKSKITIAVKDNPLLPGRNTMVRTRDGSSDTEKTMAMTFKEKERMATSVSLSMSHSMPSAKVTPK